MLIERVDAIEPTGSATSRPISTRSVAERGGEIRRTLRVHCPMAARTIDLEICVGCPKCSRLEANESSTGRPSVRCTFEAAGRAVPTVAGSVLARFASSVRGDALDAAPTAAHATPVAVVDADGRLVGLLDGGATRSTELAVREDTPLFAALAHMARHRARSVPVVDEEGVFVGSLEDLDALRALRRGSPG
jgi:hypothetical protein